MGNRVGLESGVALGSGCALHRADGCVFWWPLMIRLKNQCSLMRA